MPHALLEVHHAGRVEVTIGRASDYFGPRDGAQSNLGDRAFPAALNGQDGHRSRRPRPTPHLHPRHRRRPRRPGRKPDAAGEVWHLPNDPGTRTTRRLVETIYQLAGRYRTKLRAVPPVLLRALALANPTVRELLEMQYQFAEPFIVDSAKFATRFGVTATPLDRAVADTLDAYRHKTLRPQRPVPPGSTSDTSTATTSGSRLSDKRQAPGRRTPIATFTSQPPAADTP